MNCPRCKGVRIEALMLPIQPVMDACTYDMACLDCGFAWTLEEGTWAVRTEAEQANWANVNVIEVEEEGP